MAATPRIRLAEVVDEASRLRPGEIASFRR
jgi:hypothetical protein